MNESSPASTLSPAAASPPEALGQPAQGRSILVPLVLACIAAWLPYIRPLIAPVVVYDDYQILVQSRTWEKTLAGLWIPQNEHVMPLGRLLTFVLEQISGPLTFLPAAATFVGPLGLLVAMLLVYVFVRRELGHPLYGLLALVLFGVSSVYHQAIYWFAASFSVLALDTILLGLLAAQRWRQTGRWRYLALSVLACLLAPGWFAIGILAGPLCCLYLLPRRVGWVEERDPPSDTVGLVPRPTLQPSPHRSTRLWSFLPFVGTALFLAVSLPRSGERIMHLDHYQGQTAVQAFRPLDGLIFTARSVVDNLLLGVVGCWTVKIPQPYVYVLLALAALLAAWWLWQSPQRRLMLLGLGLVGGSYLLIYSARATWGYDAMTLTVWSRYHLLPYLGLMLFFCAGLPGRTRWFRLNADGTLTRRQWWAMCALIVVCLLIHLPRGLAWAETADGEQFAAHDAQLADLRHIEEMDARCRHDHISADAARAALPRFTLTWSADLINGWEFLRGSDDPHPLPPEEVKRLLEGERPASAGW